MDKQWTQDAHRALQDYLTTVRRALDPAEQDIDEVLQDLRSHVETELDAQAQLTVTGADVQAVVAALGLPDAPDEDDAAEPPPPWPKTWWLLSRAILFPTAAICVELITRICTEVLLDPFPIPWHILLAAMVPIGLGFVIFEMRYRAARSPLRLLAIFGFVGGVATYYGAVFLPLLPVSVLALIFFGLGLCGLAPYFALSVAWRLRRYLRAAAGAIVHSTRVGVVGFVVGCCGARL
ncbi:MAG: hypothetical protein HOI95_17705 [Chromatiales bacterium]|jgi:hypothetical protein|nr:hypothetical protein [Chromatiales bacterium]